MPFDRSRFRLRNFIVAIGVGMALVAGAVFFGVNVAVDRAVSIDAKTKAEDWAKYFIETMPDLDRLLARGKLNDQQTAVIRTAAKVGNVFRFKLYDPKGDTVLESDPEKFEKSADADHIDDEVTDVIEEKHSIISLNDGTKERNMPSIYAEAYVPVFKSDGELRAIVETYVDQTKTAAFFKATFEALAVALGLGTALAFGIPTLAYLIRTKQAREVKHKVEFLASHDPLTNLLNRNSFAELLGQRLKTRRPEDRLAVVFLDVDDFKVINDNFGHEAGDDFLKHLARCIVTHCGENDVVARVGGDEFLFALVRPSEGDILSTVDAVLAVAREQIDSRGRRIAGRVSAGVHLINGIADSVEDAIHHADLAMYQAKIDGKNAVRLFSDEMEVRMRARREVEAIVREAVDQELFEIHYQPLLHGRTKTCLGFEALLRLKGRDGIYIPPATFIPVAESIGLITKIGKWVIDEATRTAALWPNPMFVSVNLSVRQFGAEDLLGNVEAALAESGLNPNRLELEVTESLLMENTEGVARQLSALKKLGVSIAMDDFGTGYSSLGYLWQFGFDKLKIDRSFITALDVEEVKARDILDTIVTLAHKLGMTVTAEGIETDRQAEILASLSCDQFQGYLYGKPAPSQDIAPYLLRHIAAEGQNAHRDMELPIPTQLAVQGKVLDVPSKYAPRPIELSMLRLRELIRKTG